MPGVDCRNQDVPVVHAFGGIIVSRDQSIRQARKMFFFYRPEPGTAEASPKRASLHVPSAVSSRCLDS